MFVRIYFVIFALTASVPTLGAPVAAHFPGPQNKSESPNHAYSIENVDKDEAPHHSLIFVSHGETSRQKILDYQRHVDVIWAQHSGYFLVNDYVGSNEATCKLFTVPSLRNIDLVDLIKAHDATSLPDLDHLYVTCGRWRNDVVDVRLHGWGGAAADGVEREYSLNAKTQALKRIH